MVAIVLSLEPNRDTGTVFFRGAAGLLEVLSAVVTEALWRVRPWVWRASLTLALAYAVIVFQALMAEPGGHVSDGMLALTISGVVVVPLLVYINHRAREIWPPRHPRRPFNPVRVPRLSPRRRPWQRSGGAP